jgi:hypothetical protein
MKIAAKAEAIFFFSSPLPLPVSECNLGNVFGNSCEFRGYGLQVVKPTATRFSEESKVHC